MGNSIIKNNSRFVGRQIVSQKDWSKDLFLLDEFLLSHTHLINYSQDIRILLGAGEVMYIGHFVTGAIFANQVDVDMLVKDYGTSDVNRIGPQEYSSLEKIRCSVKEAANSSKIAGDCFAVFSPLDLSRVYFEFGYK